MTSEAHEPPARYLVKAEYRHTEIGVIPTDWDVKRLRDISPNQSVGLVINPSTYFDTKGTVPMLVGSNVAENRIDWNGARRISTASNERLPASRVYAGDLVTVRVGDPGVTAVIPREYSGSNCASMMIVRSHPSFDSTWLCHLMNSSYGRSRIESVQYGTAQKQFNISDAVDFQYPVPPLAEQRAIATALSDVDALIAGLERLIGKKRDIKQAAMQQLLTGQTRLPGFSGEWGSVALSSLAKIEKGQLITNDLLIPGEVPVIAGGKRPAYFHALANRTGKTITISASGASAGYVALYDQPIFASDCSTISEADTYCIDFLFFTLASRQNKIYSLQTGGAQPHVQPKDLAPLKIALPPCVDEQRAIANILSDMNVELSTLESRLAKTRLIKLGMMQELLTGRTRLVEQI